MTDAICWNCSKPLPELPLPLSRHEYCPHCAEPVHCCRMCRHYAPGIADQCREDRADPPTDRTAANFCDFFSLAPGSASATEGTGGAADRDAWARLDALFGGSAGEQGAGGPDAGDDSDHDGREAAARARLDALFGDGPPSTGED